MSVYCWGSNKCKQLPDESNIHRYGPQVISSNHLDGQAPIQIAAGDGHTVVLTESGDVFCFGRNREGQLGSPSSFICSHKVVGLDNDTIVKVAAGAMNSFAITLSGEVYQW